MVDQAALRNSVLSKLSTSHFRLLEPHLEETELGLRKMLEARGRTIKAVYFPESGFASVVADGGKRPIEVGLIGREGMTGIAVLLGKDRNANEVFMQAAGHGHCVRVGAFRNAIATSSTLHRSLLHYAYSFLEQTTRTAVANGRSKLEERLARWLLMADDRLDGPELPLTHEFLAMMLAVRRPGVTVAVQELERTGVIARRRGSIVIVDRAALEKLSNGTYAPPDG